MERYVKPIQATPTLSGKDAEAIIKQALTPPDPEAIAHLEKRLVELQKVFKE